MKTKSECHVIQLENTFGDLTQNLSLPKFYIGANGCNGFCDETFQRDPYASLLLLKFNFTFLQKVCCQTRAATDLQDFIFEFLFVGNPCTDFQSQYCLSWQVSF